MPSNEVKNYIEAEYYPTIQKSEIAVKCRFKMDANELANLSSSFSIIGAELAKLVLNPSSNEGLFRCVYPNGVTGKLAQAKDGSGYLGTILNNGIAGQARWIPAKGSATPIAIDPVTIATAVALMGINKKLDSILETQKEILNFLENDKESQLKGAVNTLSETMYDYRHNGDNDNWKIAKMSSASGIKNKAVGSIEFYRKTINGVMEKQSFMHINHQTKKVADQVFRNFKCYQLSVYLYAYASFVEVMLSDNFKRAYLDQIIRRIEDYSYQYRMDYTKCYDLLNEYTKSSVETIALNGIGRATKNVGKTIAKIPIISRGPVDEVLIAAGDTAKKLSNRNSDRTMDEFKENYDAGTKIFVESIETINMISNQPIELLFDKNTVYVCA